MSFLPTVLVAIPFVLFITLLFWRKLELVWVSLMALFISGTIAVFYWKIFPSFLIGSLEKGFFVALDIFFIILGAIFFLEILKKTKIIENIGIYLESISGDIRIQVILLAWFFENFLEGTAGFGTPGTVVAPLLIGLGITPLNAVILALLGNSTAGVFGAAGAPIKIGFGEIAGASLPMKAALFNFAGILVPVFMLWLVTRGGGDKRRSFFEMLPFAIWSGVVFVVSSALTVFMGVEFPSILGSAVGLIIILFTIKIGLFMPKNKQSLGSVRDTLATLSLKKTIFPYILLIAFLFVGKFVLGARGVPIPIAVKHTFTFFNPGFAFIFAGIIVSIFYKVPKNTFSWSLKKALVKSFKPFLVIVFMSSMAQIMVNSAQNFTGLPSMIGYLAANIKNAFLPFWSPIIGALGSFLTGSVTISNLMFGNFMATAAKELSFNVDTILALVVAGGAAGNMVALADILVAEAVVGLKNEERRILKGVILPCLIYVGLIGLIGLMVL